MRKQTEAAENGLIVRRYNGKCYPSAAMDERLRETANAVNRIQNAAIGRMNMLRQDMKDHGEDNWWSYAKLCAGSWYKFFRAHDSTIAPLSCWIPIRAIESVVLGYQAAFRRRRDGLPQEQWGFPRPRRSDRLSIPLMHDKRTGDFGAAGSGCRLTHVPPPGKTQGNLDRWWTLRIQGVEDSIPVKIEFPDEDRNLFDEFRVDDRIAIQVDLEWRVGQWHLSVSRYVEAKRSHGRRPTTVEFDLLDGIAKVNGKMEDADDLIDIALLAEEIDRMTSDRDLDFPRGTKLSDEQRVELFARNKEIASVHAYLARRRRDFLHVWTSRLVSRASMITVIAPKTRDMVKSPRGNKREWGAEIETVSTINRHILNYAPYAATQMLKYKCEEAGIRCDVVEDKQPKIGVGADLVTAGKASRRARRKLKED